MHVIVVSLNYRTAPVELREKLSFKEEQVGDAMVALNQEKSILENIIVSTCNRTELYVVADQLHTGRYYVKRFVSNWFSVDLDDVTSHVEIYEDQKAIQHLFRVSAGLDSMVLGETQILGQVKHAFQIAQDHDASGLIFNQLFKQAITAAKRGHRDTDIGEHAVSISYAAVELSKTIFGDLKNQHVVILGAGKMGELAVQNLHGSGAERVTVINRTYAKAEELASRFNGEAEPLENFESVLENADILISSAGTEDYVLNQTQMSGLLKKRNGKPIFLVDIAVPRNLDPAINELDGVFLYDIDDLQGIVDQNLAERQKAAAQIEEMIDDELDEFEEWLTTLGVVPIISALRKKALKIQEQTMASIERKMPDLTAREKKVLNKHTKSIINQMLKEPILQAKEMAGEEHADDMLKLFIRVFGIDEEVEEELKQQSTKHQSHEEVNYSLPLSGLIQAIQHR